MQRRMVQTELPEGVLLTLACGHSGPAGDLIDGEADCAACDQRRIPSITTPGRSTPMFDRDSVPPALLRAHRTNAWAELVVLDGIVEFSDDEPEWHTIVRAGERMVIVPQRDHHINPSSDAQFYVQFYDLPRRCDPGVRLI